MSENPHRKYRLADIFYKVTLCPPRPPGMPASIYHFFGYRKHLNVFFFQYHGYDVYPSTKEFDANPISSILGNVNRVIAGVHIPLMSKLEDISYMAE